MTVRGQVKESVIAIGGVIRVSGEVKENVIAVGEDVILEAGAVVGGDAVSMGGEIRRDPSAMVRGEIKGEEYWTKLTGKWDKAGRFAARFLSGRSWFGFFAWFTAALVLGWLIASLLPQPMQNQSDAIRRAPLQVLGWGVLAALLFVPLIILLAITILGLPLVPLLMLVYAYAGFIGVIACSLLLGQNLGGSLKLGNFGMLGSLAIGLLVIALVRLIPILGELVTLLVWLLGFGAVIVTRFGAQPISAASS